MRAMAASPSWPAWRSAATARALHVQKMPLTVDMRRNLADCVVTGLKVEQAQLHVPIQI